MYFVLPLGFFLVAGWYLFFGRFQQSAPVVTPTVRSGLSLTAPTVAPGMGNLLAPNFEGTPAPLGGSSTIGGSMLQNGQPTVERIGKAAALAPRGVTCFALADATSVYSSTQVLANSMFVVEKFTRVLGGMVYNDRFGWYAFSNFECTGDVRSVEVEWIGPKPTATSAPPRPRPSSTLVVVVPSAVPTLLPVGVSLWRIDGCTAQWRVSGVNAVYLNYGGKRQGVAGEANGLPVVQSLCPYTGTVTLDIYFRDGTSEHRQGVAQ